MPLSERLDEIKKLNLSVRQQLEVAELYVPEINNQIRNLQHLEMVARIFLLGPIVLDRAYTAGGPNDSSQLTQAAIVLPKGLGVCVWDSEEFLTMRRLPEIDFQVIQRKFVCFEQCDPAIKGLLLPHVEPLVDRFMRLATSGVNQAS